jgi:trehalose/maltose hydrolase-like predicted phosphorylase
MGWAGIYVTEEKLEIKPAVPEQVGFLNVKGLFYKGKQYDLKIKGDKYTLEPKN